MLWLIKEAKCSTVDLSFTTCVTAVEHFWWTHRREGFNLTQKSRQTINNVKPKKGKGDEANLTQRCCKSLMGAVEPGSELGADASSQFGCTETFYGILGHFAFPLWSDGRRIHKRYSVDDLKARHRVNDEHYCWSFSVMRNQKHIWRNSPVWFAPRRVAWQRTLNER